MYVMQQTYTFATCVLFVKNEIKKKNAMKGDGYTFLTNLFC